MVPYEPAGTVLQRSIPAVGGIAERLQHSAFLREGAAGVGINATLWEKNPEC
jgi:NAD(P)H-dependent flavin oxidoreductase YrpB (nitropropane dioxygenase family)